MHLIRSFLLPRPVQAAYLGLLLGVLAAAPMEAQGPPEIFPNGAVNAASFRPSDFPGGRAAPGAIISIFGRNFGPPDPVAAGQLPLPVELGPLRTRVMINGSEQCRLFFVSEGQINCQLPENLSGDQVRLRVMTTEGQSDEILLPLGPAGFGLFTMNRNGRGPLVAQNFTGDPDPQRRFQLNGPGMPAQGDQILVLWGTGLGPTNPPVQAGTGAPGQAPAVNQPEVWVGNVRAQVQYAGRAPGFAGLDQIQVAIPPDAPRGCAVPVRLQLGDQVSNIGTLLLARAKGRAKIPRKPSSPGRATALLF